MAVKFTYRNLLIHLAVWVVYATLQLWLFYQFFPDLTTGILRAIMIATLHATIFYFNLHVLMPRFMSRKQLPLYLISVAAVLVAVAFLFNVGEELILPEEFHEYVRAQRQRFREMPHPHSDRPDFLPKGPPMRSGKIFFGSVVSLGVFFVSTIYGIVTESREREKREMALKNQLLEAETSLLRFQINPHFLFNTLNNIYALSMMQSKKTPDAVHRLSEMLRYVIYNSNDKLVSLDQEAEYIQSYIDLQLLKDDRIDRVKVNLGERQPGLSIAPMLLIPFVENSFKHSNFENLETGWIEVNMRTDGHTLHLHVANSVSLNQPQDKVGGIGMANVRQRLQLLYPDRHQLTIEATEDSYSVNLQIDLHEDTLSDR